MGKVLKWLVTLAIIGGVGGYFGWQWWQTQQSALPAGIASGNGRIEADEVAISTKNPGRLITISVNEGDMVSAGQLVAQMDTADLEARRAQAQAQLSGARNAIAETQAEIAARQADYTYKADQYRRAASLVESGAISRSVTEQRRSARDAASASVQAATAHLTTLNDSIAAHEAALRQIDAALAETKLVAPVRGRVLYRLAQKGEVLGAGGRALTILDLSTVYMEVFLPAESAARLAVGAEARIVLDVLPDAIVPAKVTFVSPQAQFTPKQVETAEERDKLMFRVKLTIPEELVLAHIEKVKTGVRGIGYVRVDSDAAWPDFLGKPIAGQGGEGNES